MRPPFAAVPGPDQESVWDYPRPPNLALEQREVVVRWGDVEVGRTRVAGAAVRPQPGGFYGGWITPELAGPFKGEPGSQNW